MPAHSAARSMSQNEAGGNSLASRWDLRYVRISRRHSVARSRSTVGRRLLQRAGVRSPASVVTSPNAKEQIGLQRRVIFSKRTGPFVAPKRRLLSWRIGQLAGVKPTLPKHCRISAVDPFRTSSRAPGRLGGLWPVSRHPPQFGRADLIQLSTQYAASWWNRLNGAAIPGSPPWPAPRRRQPRRHAFPA